MPNSKMTSRSIRTISPFLDYGPNRLDHSRHRRLFVKVRSFFSLFRITHTLSGDHPRRVVHFGVTRSPSDAWVAQQLREATPFGAGPKYLIRDNDDKFGVQFQHTAAGIKLLKTPVHAPKANAICERFLGSVRRECLDHLPILSEGYLRRIVTNYAAYFNQARPHQGIDQQIPALMGQVPPFESLGRPIISRSVLGGLHHDHRRAT